MSELIMFLLFLHLAETGLKIYFTEISQFLMIFIPQIFKTSYRLLKLL